MNGIVLISVFLSLAGAKYTVEEVTKEYEKIFQIEVGEHENLGPYIDTNVAELTAEHFLHGFVKENYWLIHYLQVNRAGRDYGRLLELRNDSTALAEHFYHSLGEDGEFNASLLALVSGYLSGLGKELVGHDPATKDLITADQLTRIAVRFFFLSQITKDGRIKASICAGLHGLKDFEGERDLMLEAFCYEAIFKELGSQQFGMRREFESILGRVRDLQLSRDKEMKLSRAQGAAWALLASNETLRRVLSNAYQSKRGILPFVVEGLEP